MTCSTAEAKPSGDIQHGGECYGSRAFLTILHGAGGTHGKGGRPLLPAVIVQSSLYFAGLGALFPHSETDERGGCGVPHAHVDRRVSRPWYEI